MGELKRLFRPEFINRVDDIVVFQKLAGESLTRIAELLVDDLRQRCLLYTSIRRPAGGHSMEEMEVNHVAEIQEKLSGMVGDLSLIHI